MAIFGHEPNSSKELAVNVAAAMAARGIATIAINAVGCGFGPLGTLTVSRTNDGPVTFAAGGRGIDQNGDHLIASNEGFRAAPPRTIIFNVDGIRQTVADLMQLVRVIEVGMDVDGDGTADLDASRIYYFGWAVGGNYGTLLLGLDPSLRAGVLSSAGPAVIESNRLSLSRSSVVGQSLASRIPSLINAPGVTSLDGLAVAGPRFNENMPLRNGFSLDVGLEDGTSSNIQSPVVNTVAGAMAIQEVIKNTEWVGQLGSPVAYAPHLRKDPLQGVPPKSVIYQFGKGDLAAVNPSTTAILRAGNLADRATFYRHDLAFAENLALGKNPVFFMIGIDRPAFRPISLGAQEQIAVFFSSDGREIIHPEPLRFFEVPIEGSLPEGLNFIP